MASVWVTTCKTPTATITNHITNMSEVIRAANHATTTAHTAGYFSPRSWQLSPRWRQLRLSGAEEAETIKVRPRGARAHVLSPEPIVDNVADASSREPLAALKLSL